MAIVVLAGGVWVIGFLTSTKAFLPEIALPILLVASLAALLVTISSMTSVFKGLDLTNTKFALGLPEGSVRALIALSLILIFVVTSSFLFNQLESTKPSENFPPDQIAEFKDRITAIDTVTNADGETFYKVEMNTSATEASVDFAQQILTTISTLVVAVAGFYFGTRSVAVARGEEVPPGLVFLYPKSDSPLSLEGEELNIKLETKPEGQAIKWSLSNEEYGTLQPTSPSEFSFTRTQIPNQSEEVEAILKFELASDPSVTKELKLLLQPVKTDAENELDPGSGA